MAPPVVKQKMKVAPEQRGMSKVWNISDWPGSKAEMQTMMVMGASIPPGGTMEVPTEELKMAHKTKASVAAGALFIGDLPPEGYRAWKGMLPKARLPRGMARSHGGSSVISASVEAKGVASGSDIPVVVATLKAEDEGKKSKGRRY